MNASILLCAALLALGLISDLAGQTVGGVGDPAANTRSAAARVRLEGRVVNELTGEAIRQANLSLLVQPDRSPERFPDGVNAARGPGRAPQFVATSDAQGRFHFDALPPGRYRLSAEKTGYVRATYGEVPGRPAEPLTADAGRTVVGIEFKLTPQAVLSGKVLDENGDPLAGATVRILRRTGYFAFDSGRGGATSSNAVGEYLVGNLLPGRYAVLADDRVGRFGGPAAEPADPDSYMPTYYPGVVDSSAAGIITLAAGQEVRGMDVWLRKGKLYRISGRVLGVDAGDGERVRVSIASRDAASNARLPFGPLSRAGRDASFIFNGVPPGNYLLTAVVAERGEAPARTGSATVTVANTDVEDLEISVLRGDPMTITGRVRVEGAEGIPIRAGVSLAPEGLFVGRPPSSRIQKDGSFTMDNVPPAVYRVGLLPIPDGTYLKSVAVRGVELPGETLDLSHTQAMPPIEIVLGARPGRITGIVKNGEAPYAGAMVALAPEPFDSAPARLRRSVTADANGGFSLNDVAPGDYRLYAWQESFPLRMVAAADLKPYESHGVSVHLEEGEQKQMDLQVVPLP